MSLEYFQSDAVDQKSFAALEREGDQVLHLDDTIYPLRLPDVQLQISAMWPKHIPRRSNALWDTVCTPVTMVTSDLAKPGWLMGGGIKNGK